MYLKSATFAFLAITLLIGCRNESAIQEVSTQGNQTDKVRLNPLDDLAQVDNLLSEIAEEPQRLTALSNKTTAVTGEQGTIIHVEPRKLETLDGSPLGDKIDIELLELTDISSMLAHNAQTVSNDQILITGGAYYLNMTSDGNQLKLKQGTALSIEFPKLSEDEMGLFLGERDSLGQMNWIPTETNFKPKNIEDVERPQKPASKDAVSDSVFGSEFGGPVNQFETVLKPKNVNKADVSDEEYKLYLKKLKAYEEQLKEIEYRRQTYEAVELLNFGWINCDRFYEYQGSKIDIALIFHKDSVPSARFFAVFKDINSVMSSYYFKGQKVTPFFRRIPYGKEVTIVALSAENQTPYYFETTIDTKNEKEILIKLEETTQAEIKEKLTSLN